MNPLEVNPALKPFYARGRTSEFRAQRLRDVPVGTPTCDGPEKAVEFLRQAMQGASWANPEVEQFVAVSLNTRRRATGFWLVSFGTMDTLLVHPREVFRTAILVSASAILLAHNHPSGDPTPSENDIKVTRELIRAGQLLRLEVADHIILGKPGYDGSLASRGWVSLRELGYFYS